MEPNLRSATPEASIETFIELLKTALLFDPVTHPSQYAKAQEFRVLPKGKFNALATEYEGQALLPGPRYEFNLGIWFALLDSVACICANEDFFSEIETGPVREQIEETFEGTNRFQDYSRATDKTVLIYPHVPAFDSAQRRELADQQIEIAVKFISLHEQAHVFAGHLLYVNNFGHGSLLEVNEDEGSAVSNQARRAIELQADSVAFQTLLQMSFGNIGPLHSNEKRFFNIRSNVDWLVACVSATVIVCCLFEIADTRNAKAPLYRQHPSAKCRALSIFQTFISILIEIVYTDEELHTAIRRVLKNIESIFSILKAAPLEKEAIKWSWKPSGPIPDCDSVIELIELRGVLDGLDKELLQCREVVQDKLRPA